MKKNEDQKPHNTMILEFKKIEAFYDLLGKIVTYAGYAVIAYIIMNGLKPILIPGGANEISAISQIISALRPGSYLGYILTIIFFFLYRIERKGKKRAISEKERYQKLAEKTELNRTSSNLTETGDTPKDGESK